MKFERLCFYACEAAAAWSSFVKIDQGVQQLKAWAETHSHAYTRSQKSNMRYDVVNLFFLERLAKKCTSLPTARDLTSLTANKFALARRPE